MILYFGQTIILFEKIYVQSCFLPFFLSKDIVLWILRQCSRIGVDFKKFFEGEVNQLDEFFSDSMSKNTKSSFANIKVKLSDFLIMTLTSLKEALLLNLIFLWIINFNISLFQMLLLAPWRLDYLKNTSDSSNSEVSDNSQSVVSLRSL